MRVCVSVPEKSNAETDHDVVERVEAHHAHQQILQDDLKRRGVSYSFKPCCVFEMSRFPVVKGFSF